MKRGLGSPLMVTLAVLCAAPTVGDIGSCNEAADPLDPVAFFALRDQDECAACKSCGLSTARCDDACNPSTILPATFPPGCSPVVHDGEVCLRALQALSCSRFAEVVEDPPIVPTECDFCPAADAVETTSGDAAIETGLDAGAEAATEVAQ